MATYVEFARTNTFEVADIEAFKRTIEDYDLSGVEIVAQHPDNPNKIVLLMTENGVPFIDADDAEASGIDDPYDDFFDLIADHLVDGSICIVMGSWSEGRRGCGGWARSFDKTGEGVIIDTGDIQRQTEELFNLEPRSLGN